MGQRGGGTGVDERLDRAQPDHWPSEKVLMITHSTSQLSQAANDSSKTNIDESLETDSCASYKSFCVRLT